MALSGSTIDDSGTDSTRPATAVRLRTGTICAHRRPSPVAAPAPAPIAMAPAPPAAPNLSAPATPGTAPPLRAPVPVVAPPAPTSVQASSTPGQENGETCALHAASREYAHRQGLISTMDKATLVQMLATRQSVEEAVQQHGASRGLPDPPDLLDSGE